MLQLNVVEDWLGYGRACLGQTAMKPEKLRKLL